MKRILFVEDDPLVAHIYKEALTREGFQVQAAADGVAATTALDAGKPDILVVDLMMPKLNGVEVLNFVRSQPELAAVPVIVLSNSYIDSMPDAAGPSGVQRALL